MPLSPIPPAPHSAAVVTGNQRRRTENENICSYVRSPAAQPFLHPRGPFPPGSSRLRDESPDEMERPDDRTGPDRGAVAGKAELPADAAVRAFHMQVHEPDGLLLGAAVRAG